ncbi:MAG: cysteine desulfurase [Candidatus Rokubacteria bacterium]|nr:cysteine desulfurase [Candidatus Rokubacteria bacterium]
MSSSRSARTGRSGTSSSGKPTSLAPSIGQRIYLDYGGYAPVDPRVLAVMATYLEGWVGNPSALHSLGEEARESLEGTRAKVARLIGGRAEGVIFTSGATEANNLAIKGVALRAAERGRHLVTSAIEHISVLTPCRDLTKAGFGVSHLPVDREGRVNPEQLVRTLRPDTVLVSLGCANAEAGTVQPIRELARVLRGRGVLLHVDGVGAVGRVPLHLEDDGIDLLTLSANDLYGPPGVGALYAAPGVKLLPQLLGGGQEHGLRSGTENLAGIAGFGLAAELMRREGSAEVRRLGALREALIEGVLARCEGTALTGPRTERLPHHASFTVQAVKGESLVMALDLAGIAASTGSACASLTQEPSHVLRALGLDPRAVEGSLCFTLGRWSTREDVEGLLRELPQAVERLRAISPLARARG